MTSHGLTDTILNRCPGWTSPSGEEGGSWKRAYSSSPWNSVRKRDEAPRLAQSLFNAQQHAFSGDHKSPQGKRDWGRHSQPPS